MPRLLETMKDVISCDKLRGGAIAFDPKISEWGNPVPWSGIIPQGKLTRRTETSKYPEEKKTIVIPQVVASEKGRAQTVNVQALAGLQDLDMEK